MSRARYNARLLKAGAAAALLAALLTALAAPSSASAGVFGTPIPNPLHAVKHLIGLPGHVAGTLGASVLQDALEWLLGGLKTTITLGLVKFLVHVELDVGESLARLTAPLIVIGGFFLVVGLITSIGDGYRQIATETDTAPRVIGQAIFRTIGLAILLGSWFWLVPLAVDVANGMSGYVLSDAAVAHALRRTFAAETLLHVGFPLLGLLTGVMLAFAMLVLVVLKFVIAIAFAALYVGGPVLIGFAALPHVGNLPLTIATRGLFTLTIIPLLWAVVFAAWAGVSAGMFDTATGGGGVVAGLMGPGLFLAGLVVMLGVTKKVLAMAAFGIALSVPGAGIARSVMVVAATRRLGAATSGATTAGVGSRGRDEAGSATPVAAEGSRKPAPSLPGPVQSRQEGTRPYRTLDTRPGAEQVQRERVVYQRRVSAANSILGVDEHGAFVPPRGVSREAVEDVARAIDARRARAEVSVDEVRYAGDAITVADRAAFATAAEVAQREDPGRARRHFSRTASVQIAAAPALDESERKAAIAIASARPEVVQRAFAPDYRSFSGGSEEAADEYDSRLMDQHGGLERLRDEAEAGRTGGHKPPDREEDLPF